jgi:UDP-N-acetylmuramoyl-tripeptide--D-alanyl-D-alanine ligase
VLRASHLATLFGGRLEGDAPHAAPIPALRSDSREIEPGDGFVALPGEQADGHAWVAEAARRGAALAVVRRGFVPDGPVPPLLLLVEDTAAALRHACSARLDEIRCRVIGVTGSVGKTTAKEMCAAALGPAAAKTPGNLNTWTQIPLAVLALDEATPFFVCEMGMSARGEIADLTGFTNPSVGLLLNIGLAHVGLLGSQEAIAEAKAELLDALPRQGHAVLNGDDPWVRRVASHSVAPIAWFGIDSEDASWRGGDLVLDGLRGSRTRINGPDGAADLTLRLPGRHAVVDAIAAVAVAGVCGVSTADAVGRLDGFEAPEHRGRVLTARNGATIVDDSYNCSPTSLEAALAVLGETRAARRVALIGDMLELGDQTDAAHLEAGRHAGRVATDVIAVGDNAKTIAAGASETLDADRVRIADDAGAAASVAAPLLDADTVVLVKASHGLHLERVVAELTA